MSFYEVSARFDWYNISRPNNAVTLRKERQNRQLNDKTGFEMTTPNFIPLLRVYLDVRTCELFLCFVTFVFLGSIVFTSHLFSLFYITRECNRFLLRGCALTELIDMLQHPVDRDACVHLT